MSCRLRRPFPSISTPLRPTALPTGRLSLFLLSRSLHPSPAVSLHLFIGGSVFSSRPTRLASHLPTLPPSRSLSILSPAAPRSAPFGQERAKGRDVPGHVAGRLTALTERGGAGGGEGGGVPGRWLAGQPAAESLSGRGGGRGRYQGSGERGAGMVQWRPT